MFTGQLVLNHTGVQALSDCTCCLAVLLRDNVPGVVKEAVLAFACLLRASLALVSLKVILFRACLRLKLIFGSGCAISVQQCCYVYACLPTGAVLSACLLRMSCRVRATAFMRKRHVLPTLRLSIALAHEARLF